jgi:hypothetical protein
MRYFRNGFCLAIALSFIVAFSSSQAEAGDITTSESLLKYARDSIVSILGEDGQLVPGSIDIFDEAVTVDLRNAFRSMVGAEQKFYRLDFRVSDAKGIKYFARARLVVSALWSLDDEKSQDNNTAQRIQDEGTGRLIRVQIQPYLGRPDSSSAPMSARYLYLRKIN